MKIINAFLAIVFFTSCYTTHHNNSNNKETSFLIDELYSQKNGNDNLYIHDLLGINLVSYNLVPDKVCKVIIDKPTLVSVNSTYYIVYPGDNIKITYNDKEDVLFKIDDNKQRNNEFVYQLILEKIRHSLVPKIPDSLQNKSIDTILNFELKLNEQIPVYLKRLNIASDSISSLLKISDSFKLMANANLQNEVISIKSQFNFIFHNKLKENNLYFSRQIEILKLLNEIQNPYQVKLYGFNNIYDVARDLLPDKIRRLENEDALINNINILGSNFKGIAKDYILGKQMFEFLKTNSIISDKAYRYYKKKSVDNEYNFIVKNIRDASKVFSKKSKKYKYDRLIVANNLKVTTIEEIIKKGKGKIILLDFWASWCQPCLEQMEYWNKLKKDYRDKEIEFISISIDTDLNSWLRKNELLGFDLEKSFITENKLNQKFIKFHDISFIPRLILIDKNGNIIDDNTPEPSDNALKVLIDKNL